MKPVLALLALTAYAAWCIAWEREIERACCGYGRGP